MKRGILIMVACLILAGCAASAPPETSEAVLPETVPTTAATEPPTTLPPDPVEVLLEEMTLEEKVGQLFLARCPAEGALEDIRQYHLAGYVLFDRDVEGQTRESLTQKIAQYQEAAEIPLLIAVDEEGGSVCRISNHSAFRHSPFPAPRKLYEQGGLELVLSIEAEKAILLSSLGIQVNLAPVCDITTDPGGFLYSRSLGQDWETVSAFVRGTVAVMAEYRVGSVLKHFPGYGNNGDTHTGMAIDGRALEALEQQDLHPFAAGIEAGCGAVMVSHTVVQALDDQAPATLSPAVHRYLRETMGFSGVIVTDDLAMQAITDHYGTGEAAVLAVLAGNDLLCCSDYREQYTAVLEAVRTGRISQAQLDSAVTRVLQWKQALNLL